jgi:TatD DNase family protein
MIHTIDTHSHFNLEQFSEDRDQAIARMKAAGVGTICIGVDEETSTLAVELAHQEGIWACIGQHPTEWETPWDGERMQTLAIEHKVVAIGECGLDYFRERDRAHKPEQVALFRAHLELAQKNNLPLMLHIRPEQGTMNAYEDALDILEEYPNLRGTAHFFAGTPEIAQQFLNLGFYISFSGIITIFPEYEAVVRAVPIERILSETDSPFAAPLSHRGRRCEPQYVTEIVEKIAQLKALPLDVVREALFQNATTLFNLQTT